MAAIALALPALLSGCADDMSPPGGMVKIHDYLPGFPRPAPPANPGGCVVTKVAQLPLSAFFRHVEVPVKLDHRLLPMIVDTGASASAISAETARLLNDRTDPYRRIKVTDAAGGVSIRHPIIVNSIEFGEYDIQYHEVDLVKLLSQNQQDQETTPAGLIGRDLLAKYDVELDFQNRSMTLYTVSSCSENFVPWSSRYDVFLAARAANGALVVPVTLNGVTVHATLDTGSSSSSMPRTTAEFVGVDGSALDADPVSYFDVASGKRVGTHRHRFASMSVGSSTFHNVTLSVQDGALAGTDMLLGLDFLRSKKLWLSFGNGRIFMQTSLPTKLGARVNTGIVIRRKSDD